MRRGLVLLLLLIVGLPLVFPGLVSRLAPFMLYYPTRLSEAAAEPGAWGLPAAEEAVIRTADDLKLHAWWVPANAASGARSCGAVVYFHGNAGHLADRAPIAQALSSLGFDALLVDYRGYGRSEGKPSEAGLYLDGEAAYAYVLEERRVPAGRVVLAGNSLGGAVAVAVASRVEAGALVVTSTFRTLPELARTLYPWLPGRLFRWELNRFDSATRIGGVDMPVFIGWGQRDDLVSRGQTFGLYEAAAEPKTWFESQTADHNNLWSETSFWLALKDFLEKSLAC